MRKFSEILSHVQYKGDSYIVVRAGKSVAAISPIVQLPRGNNLGELRSLLAFIPKFGDEADAFESDVNALRQSQSGLPKAEGWE